MLSAANFHILLFHASYYNLLVNKYCGQTITENDRDLQYVITSARLRLQLRSTVSVSPSLLNNGRVLPSSESKSHSILLMSLVV